MADEWVDGQILLNQPHVPRAGLFPELSAGLLLRRAALFGSSSNSLQVEEHEADAGFRELRKQIERKLALATAGSGLGCAHCRKRMGRGDSSMSICGTWKSAAIMYSFFSLANTGLEC